MFVLSSLCSSKQSLKGTHIFGNWELNREYIDVHVQSYNFIKKNVKSWQFLIWADQASELEVKPHMGKSGFFQYISKIEQYPQSNDRAIMPQYSAEAINYDCDSQVVSIDTCCSTGAGVNICAIGNCVSCLRNCV